MTPFSPSSIHLYHTLRNFSENRLAAERRASTYLKGETGEINAMPSLLQSGGGAYGLFLENTGRRSTTKNCLSFPGLI